MNAVCARDPPRRAMDFAAASKRGNILDVLRRHGGKGLCEKGEQGGFVQRGKFKGHPKGGKGGKA